MPEKLKPGPVPKEALDYFSSKKLQPSFDYRDVWREEHAHAHAIAKMTKADLLGDVKDSLAEALREGQTLKQWSRQITPRLQEAGWWGVKEARDPLTGELRQVQLGSPRRLKTIYRTNMRTARAAGQWERIQRNKARQPYLLYRLGPSETHRPEHVAWDGLMLPVDDPFWQTHYPQNGWGCKCHVRQVSQRQFDQYQKDGLPTGPGTQEINPATGLPTGRRLRDKQKPKTQAPPITTREVLNKRTGELEQVPIGIDPGWDTNPGIARTRALNKKLKDKEQRFRERLEEPFPETVVTDPVFGEVDTALFTTGSITQAGIENTLAGVPGTEPQRKLLQSFLQAHPQKVLFISPNEMSPSSAASKAIETAVVAHLGDQARAFGRQTYIHGKPGRINGFTSNAFEHVVVKVPKSEVLDIAAEDLRQGIEDAIKAFKKGDRLWSMSAATGKRSRKARALLTTMIHELGHQVHYWAGAPNRPDGLPHLTEYSGFNKHEWHAEHFTAWFYNRDALYKAAPEIAEYFDDLIADAIASTSKRR